jgi:IS30 family transposase
LQKIRKRNKLEQQYKNNNNIITKRLKLFNRLTSIKRYIASKAKLQENKKALALLKERKNKVAANLKLTPEGKVKLITKLRRNFSSLPTNMQRKILSLARSK